MPYKKKYYRRRRRYTRRPRSRWSTYGAAGKQLWKDVKMLKSIVNVEEKYHDNTLTTTTTDNIQKAELNLIPRGDGAQERDGREVKAIKFMATGSIKHNSSGNPSQTVRLLVVCRVQNPDTNSGIIVTDILQGNTAPTGAAAITAFYNKTKMKGYRVLLDKKITVSTDYPEKYFFFKMPGQWHMRFDGQATPTVSNVPYNICQLLHVGDQTTANYPSIRFNSRLIYVDN